MDQKIPGFRLSWWQSAGLCIQRYSLLGVRERNFIALSGPFSLQRIQLSLTCYKKQITFLSHFSVTFYLSKSAYDITIICYDLNYRAILRSDFVTSASTLPYLRQIMFRQNPSVLIDTQTQSNELLQTEIFSARLICQKWIFLADVSIGRRGYLGL